MKFSVCQLVADTIKDLLIESKKRIKIKKKLDKYYGKILQLTIKNYVEMKIL